MSEATMWGYDRPDLRDRFGRNEGRAARRNAEARGFGDEHRGTPVDETATLISAQKVEGVPVFDRRGRRMGRVETFMVGKRSGRVAYAVLSFGGFLGMGERHYPLPWNELTYDERCGGYVVNMTRRDLERAPSHRPGAQPDWDDRYGRDIEAYYGMW